MQRKDEGVDQDSQKKAEEDVPAIAHQAAVLTVLGARRKEVPNGVSYVSRGVDAGH